jgi:hypothetical protein
MINYNIVLYIGLFLIIGGFCLFLYSQHRLRQLDIEQFKNEQLTPMTQEEEYRNAGITKEEINENNS